MNPLQIIIIIIYLAAIGFLGYRGFRGTKNATDYMVGGRQIHPFVMALSYGATFISTSALVGFGGFAGLFGMSLLWLTFLNIFVGIFIAFVFFGKRTRQMGHNLNAHTFPEFLGKRFNSRFIQGFSGLIIFCFMPLYSAAVLVGAARLLETIWSIDYNLALLIFAVIVTAYVVFGGLKGVMYTDAFQGSIMFIGMLFLIIFAYVSLGGITTAHKKLSQVDDQVKQEYKLLVDDLGEETVKLLTAELLQNKGKNIKSLGEGDSAQFDIAGKIIMDKDSFVKAKKAILNHFVVYSGKVIPPGFQGWSSMPKFPSVLWMIVITSITLGVGIGVLAQPQLAVRFMTVRSNRELNRAVLIGGLFILLMTGVAFVTGALSNALFFEKSGEIAMVKGGLNIDKIIPTFIDSTLPGWFATVFLLTILAAGMSTLSSQFHAMGTSIGRDVFEMWIMKGKKGGRSVLVTRFGILLTVIAAVLLAMFASKSGFIARATAIFFGLSAASFLPSYFAAIYWKRATKIASISSIVSGFSVSAIWLTFFQGKESKALGICAALFGKAPLSSGLWTVTDAIVISLPLSILVLIVVSLLTKAPDKKEVETCFKKLAK